MQQSEKKVLLENEKIEIELPKALKRIELLESKKSMTQNLLQRNDGQTSARLQAAPLLAEDTNFPSNVEPQHNHQSSAEEIRIEN